MEAVSGTTAASKDVCSGVLFFGLLLSAVYQCLCPSYLDPKMAKFVQRSSLGLLGLAFIIT